MAVLKLQVDKPVPGALKFAKGKFGESKFPGGDYYMYTLTSGDVIFLEQKICDEPDQLFAAKDIGKEDPFVITLRKTKSGGKFYEVHKLSDTEEEPQLDPRRYPDAAGTFEEPSKLEAQLEASVRYEQQRKVETLSKVGPPAAANQNPGLGPVSDSNAIHHTAASKLMAGALIAAVDAIRETERYAHIHQVELQFDAEDVRCIAATLFIQAAKDPTFLAPYLQAQKVNGGATWTAQ